MVLYKENINQTIPTSKFEILDNTSAFGPVENFLCMEDKKLYVCLRIMVIKDEEYSDQVQYTVTVSRPIINLS